MAIELVRGATPRAVDGHLLPKMHPARIVLHLNMHSSRLCIDLVAQTRRLDEEMM